MTPIITYWSFDSIRSYIKAKIIWRLALMINDTAFIRMLERRATYGGRKGRRAIRRLREVRREAQRAIDRFSR